MLANTAPSSNANQKAPNIIFLFHLNFVAVRSFGLYNSLMAEGGNAINSVREYTMIHVRILIIQDTAEYIIWNSIERKMEVRPSTRLSYGRKKKAKKSIQVWRLSYIG